MPWWGWLLSAWLVVSILIGWGWSRWMRYQREPEDD